MRVVDHEDGGVSVIGFVGRCPNCKRLRICMDEDPERRATTRHPNVLYRAGEDAPLGWAHAPCLYEPTNSASVCSQWVRPLPLSVQRAFAAAYALGGLDAVRVMMINWDTR